MHFSLKSALTACLCFYAAIALLAAPPAGAAEPKTYEGQVSRDHNAAFPLGNRLSFEADVDGFRVVADRNHDLAVVNYIALHPALPLRGHDITTFQPAYGLNALQTVKSERYFCFLSDPADEAKAIAALNVVYWPYTVKTEAERQAAMDAMADLPKGYGHLSIVDADIDGKPAGKWKQSAHKDSKVTRVKFKLDIYFQPPKANYDCL